VAQVTATQSIDIAAAPDATLAALADYATVRPQILPEQYLDYQVVNGTRVPARSRSGRCRRPRSGRGT